MTKAKAYAALAFGLVGEAVTLGLVPDRWQAVAGGFVALGVALGVYARRSARRVQRAEQAEGSVTNENTNSHLHSSVDTIYCYIYAGWSSGGDQSTEDLY